MRRWLFVLVAVLVIVVIGGAAAVAISAAYDDDRTGAPYRWGMGMRSEPGPAWRHGALVEDEFGYLAEMVAHHEEAVEAATELARSSRPEMRAFGEDIVRTQSVQIALMRGWLREWYPDRDPEIDYQPMMRDLSDLSGDALDRVFLEDMIMHHMVAVMMSQQLLVRDIARHEEVADLAQAIRDEQRAEILTMQQWLADWFGGWWHHHNGPWMRSSIG
jgi:uncharacterized protein (DUF305 family)